MKRMLIWMLVLMLCTAAVPVSCFAYAKDMEEEMLKEAYAYTLPLVMVKATEIKATNTVNATRLQVPVNQMIHAEKLANPPSPGDSLLPGKEPDHS